MYCYYIWKKISSAFSQISFLRCINWFGLNYRLHTDCSRCMFLSLVQVTRFSMVVYILNEIIRISMLFSCIQCFVTFVFGAQRLWCFLYFCAFIMKSFSPEELSQLLLRTKFSFVFINILLKHQRYTSHWSQITL